MKRGGLGRGLSALIPGATEEVGLFEVPVGAVQPNPKHRILRELANLLDERLPTIAGCEINDNPYQPLCKACRLLIEARGDQIRALPLRDLERRAKAQPARLSEERDRGDGSERRRHGLGVPQVRRRIEFAAQPHTTRNDTAHIDLG